MIKKINGTFPVPYEKTHWKEDENGFLYICVRDEQQEEEKKEFGRMMLDIIKNNYCHKDFNANNDM